MRVIAGTWKGIPLRSPVGFHARPTTDRVKEAMFSLLGIDIGPYTAVDLFAGSGALGIEALSRGSPSCIFVDNHGQSLQAVRFNLQRCKADSEQFHVWRTDWKNALSRIAQEKIDVGWLFVDPPYERQLWEPVLQSLSEYGVSVHDGVVCEHPKSVTIPSEMPGFAVKKQRAYGDISVTIYGTARDEG